MSRVIHFEINADKPERAVTFYSKVFGWKIENFGGPEDYWLAGTGAEGEPGINGAILRRTSNLTTVNTISVISVDDAIKDIERAGGKMIQPKMPIPGIGYFSYCQDTEGNVFGVMQSDQSAK
jgi:predicted enzyme related to lactoylglutathione lyase